MLSQRIPQIHCHILLQRRACSGGAPSRRISGEQANKGRKRGAKVIIGTKVTGWRGCEEMICTVSSLASLQSKSLVKTSPNSWWGLCSKLSLPIHLRSDKNKSTEVDWRHVIGPIYPSPSSREEGRQNAFSSAAVPASCQDSSHLSLWSEKCFGSSTRRSVGETTWRSGYFLFLLSFLLVTVSGWIFKKIQKHEVGDLNILICIFMSNLCCQHLVISKACCQEPSFERGHPGPLWEAKEGQHPPSLRFSLLLLRSSPGWSERHLLQGADFPCPPSFVPEDTKARELGAPERRRALEMAGVFLVCLVVFLITIIGCFLGYSGLSCEWVLVTQWCLTLCDPMDCSRSGSSVHGILQGRMLEWVALPFSRGSSQARDRTQVPHIAGEFFTIWATREALEASGLS